METMRLSRLKGEIFVKTGRCDQRISIDKLTLDPSVSDTAKREDLVVDLG